MTDLQKCKQLILQGVKPKTLRRMGFSDEIIQSAYGRDPEHVSPYGDNNSHL